MARPKARSGGKARQGGPAKKRKVDAFDDEDHFFLADEQEALEKVDDELPEEAEVEETAEEKRLRLGVTTSFQVLQIQQDLTTARLQELRALISYETALVDLQIADGSLLDNLGIKLEVSDTETPVGYWESIRPRWE